VPARDRGRARDSDRASAIRGSREMEKRAREGTGRRVRRDPSDGQMDDGALGRSSGQLEPDRSVWVRAAYRLVQRRRVLQPSLPKGRERGGTGRPAG